ncbi:hypothetical protein [Enterobacter sp.]|uniref:hypothetical protein n=1 Tax=Enterobacter sp. TaxID=42895 RepID=UPI00296E498D|nr:hypothetical protein [Enterobacter sp.]
MNFDYIFFLPWVWVALRHVLIGGIILLRRYYKMTLNSIRNALFAAMHGMTPEEYELQKARDNLKSVTDDFLAKHPEALKPKTTPNLKTGKTIIKMLGADSRPVVTHTADHIDPEVLERAKAACRKLVADNPERYGHIVKQQGAE